MRAELRDGLEYLYADSGVGASPCRRMRVDAARGATASVHVLVNDATPGATLRAAVRRDGREAREAQWFRLVHVPVEVNTGPKIFIEKKGERNRYVARRAPFRVYDAMAPVGSAIKVTSPTMALRLHVPIAANARAGRREYALTIESGKERHAFSLDVRVHGAAVPAVGRDSFPYTNWFELGLMAQRHGLKAWSAAHWRMIRRYADLMVRVRQNVFRFELADVFSLVRGKAVLNRERLRRLVGTFLRAGMHYIEGGHLAHRMGEDWKLAILELKFAKVAATSPQGNAALAGMTGQLMDEIERHGWRGRWLQHVADEPTATNAADYRILVGMARKYMPGIPIVEATMDENLVGSVDIWCPQPQEYEKHRARFEAQRALGDRVWYYTCCTPGGAWLNRLLDQELLRPALLGWGAALYGLDGFLHWGLNCYRPGQDPFEQSVVPHGPDAFLPAGDTHVVYPGADGPWSSLRLEAQREGFEDYELLRLLRARNARKADAIVRRAIRGFSEYTKDVKVFRAARRALLEALAR
jgi:hypothetical protein